MKVSVNCVFTPNTIPSSTNNLPVSDLISGCLRRMGERVSSVTDSFETPSVIFVSLFCTFYYAYYFWSQPMI